MFGPRAADLDMVDVENALLRRAVGDHADEAAVLLLINFRGHWLPQLQSVDLITPTPDLEEEGWWAQIAWPDLEPALATSLIVGSSGEVRLLRGAASLADGHPVDLGDLAGALDRRALTLPLAAIAHAAVSHDHRQISHGPDGVAHLGEPCHRWSRGLSGLSNRHTRRVRQQGVLSVGMPCVSEPDAVQIFDTNTTC